MKIAMVARNTLYSSPGGDTVQIEKTAKYLQLMNIDVDIILTKEKINYEKYDLLHFFNLIRPSDILPHFGKANRFVVSTIFVEYTESEKITGTITRRILARFFSPGFIEYIKVIARGVKGKEKVNLLYLLLGHKRSMRLLFSRASAVLPNSKSELKRCITYLKVPPKNFGIVPNGIDCEDYQDVRIDKEFLNSVICVGRIERSKNQLNTIRAMNGLPYNCFIIGKPSLNDMRYYEKCKKEAKSNVQFMQHIPQNELFSIMKSAKVSVLASWFETTGLVSLEAAYLGCKLVITSKGDQKEYFGNYVEYCDPGNVDSIKQAIINAYSSKRQNELKRKIQEEYTWEKAAEATFDVYKRVL